MILFCVICSLGIIQPTKKQKTAGATNGVKIIKINKIYFKNSKAYKGIIMLKNMERAAIKGGTLDML